MRVFSASGFVSVGELSDNEVLNIEYTLLDPAGGEQLIIRWLTDAEDEIDPKVADVTASGTTEDATQPENAAKLRAYVVSGDQEIDYSCSLSE